MPWQSLQESPDHGRTTEIEMVLPGKHLVVDEESKAISTLLGSCVAACIRDRRSGIGGLNHFLLPGDDSQACARYGTYAMEVLINDILSRGARRQDLEAKVFGGAAVIISSFGFNIGRRNGEFVLGYLANEGIEVKARDLGGVRGRRLVYRPLTGEARVQYLSDAQSRQAAADEARLDVTMASNLKTGTVELFG